MPTLEDEQMDFAWLAKTVQRFQILNARLDRELREVTDARNKLNRILGKIYEDRLDKKSKRALKKELEKTLTNFIKLLSKISPQRADEEKKKLSEELSMIIEFHKKKKMYRKDTSKVVRFWK